MSKSLVIVESPAKAKTISKYLGKDFTVEASVGHIKDLPKNKIGVDLSDGSFTPELIVIPGKEKVVDRLKKLARSATTVYLAPDPDREGEAIAAHLEDELKGLSKGNSIRRVTFNEITAKAVAQTLLCPLTRSVRCCSFESGVTSPARATGVPSGWSGQPVATAESPNYPLWMHVVATTITTPHAKQRERILLPLREGYTSFTKLWEETFFTLAAFLGLRIRTGLDSHSS